MFLFRLDYLLGEIINLKSIYVNKRRHIMKKLIIVILGGILIACAFWSPPAFAGDVEVELNSSNGSTAFEVMDSTSAVQAQIDSDGNMVIRGGLRLDSGGAEHTTPEQLIVDDRIGIGTTSPDANLDIEDLAGSEFIRLSNRQ